LITTFIPLLICLLTELHLKPFHSQSTGTPTFKGIKAKVEVVKNGKVLDAVQLISKLKEV
jgi:formylmethanofuran dehydrogenase subunit D